MIFDKKGTTTTVFQENSTLKEFLTNLNSAYNDIENDNIIVNLFSFSTITADDLLEFLSLSNTHREAGKSFVLVTEKITYNEIPEQLIVAPSIQEAHDIIEMEEIERDLGL